MQYSEKIGSFYLGQEVNASKEGDLILYDAKDLTTHAVIIGMTGSGKTGLGITIIEEALIDGIPVIAIDPKGDMGNLLLTFPDMQSSDFLPYIDPSECQQTGKTAEQLATEKCELWQSGLEKSGQSKDRIKMLRETVDMNLYTPGATFGQPISLLRSFDPPNKIIADDKSLYQERISAATTGLLSLISAETNPLGKESILISKIFENYWDKGQSISVATLIAVIQKPPFDKIGVMDLETIFPEKDRVKLSMQLNSLIASPKFENWTLGKSLDAGALYFGENGKPQLSVMNIAHLSEEERIFFVTMLLNEILAWMRTQSGTGSLRAILYIDELFGYMPPVGNPATKPLLLTLLKQARAYGLGIVLSTQNPVDLDYKGLSNTGTWFIGKLQTEQDRERVTSGLLSASENGMDKKQLNAAFDKLGKRKFLMHNIHESELCIMTTRWVMSYLAGPLSREQIQALNPDFETAKNENKVSSENVVIGEKTLLPAGINEFLVPAKQAVTDTSQLVYKPCLVAVLDLFYADTKSALQTNLQSCFIAEFQNSALAIDWRKANEINVSIENIVAASSANFNHVAIPSVALRKELYKDWEKSLFQWLKQEKPLTLLQCDTLKMFSEHGESESQFRQRLTQSLKEERDVQLDKVRASFGKKLAAIELKLDKAEQKIKKESDQVSGKTVDAVLSAGVSILSSFLGRKRVSSTNVRSIGGALRKAGSAWTERGDVSIAKDEKQALTDEMTALEAEFNKTISDLTEQYDINQITINELNVFPKAGGINLQLFGLGWLPGVVENGEWQSV